MIPPENPPYEISIRIYNDSVEDQEIPFATLSSVLSEMQQAVYLLALQQEKREVGERARIPADIEQRYALHASVPSAGSYIIPAHVGTVHENFSSRESIISVMDNFRRCSQAIGAASGDILRDIVPDGQLRRRVLERFRSMIPKPGSGWALEMIYAHSDRVILGPQERQHIGRFLHRAATDAMTCTVTGKLVKIDFQARKLTLFYPVTQRELDCYYDASIEELLVQNRRELIQVTGTVTFDDNDHPKQISDIEDIRDVDLSAFVLGEFRYHERILRFRYPLEIIPTLDESQQLLCLEYSPLGIDVCAHTREELELALREEVDVLWRNYAMENPALLTADAQRVQAALSSAIEEVKNAEG